MKMSKGFSMFAFFVVGMGLMLTIYHHSLKHVMVSLAVCIAGYLAPRVIRFFFVGLGLVFAIASMMDMLRVAWNSNVVILNHIEGSMLLLGMFLVMCGSFLRNSRV